MLHEGELSTPRAQTAADAPHQTTTTLNDDERIARLQSALKKPDFQPPSRKMVAAAIDLARSTVPPPRGRLQEVRKKHGIPKGGQQTALLYAHLRAAGAALRITCAMPRCDTAFCVSRPSAPHYVRC